MAENRKNFYPWVLFGGGVLLVLAGLIWVVFNRPATPVTTPTPASVSQVLRVSLEDAKAAFDAKTAVFLDVRDSSSYAAGHIPGALLIPVSDLAARIVELDRKAWIIPYCT
jgi:3-mercaptopyruvate sulfurtransferase SseA